MSENNNLQENTENTVNENAVEETATEETAAEETAAEETAAAEQIGTPIQKSVKQKADTEPQWYVVHTYSGYENKVKADIEKTIENRKLENQMFEVMVPTQEVSEIKNGVRKTVTKKLFPGYVLVHMIKNDVTWYVVRNTRGVTGFVGPGSEPVPLTELEMRKLGVKYDNVNIDLEIGDRIKVISGAWEGSEGVAKAINAAKQTVTIDTDIFGRSTSVEIEINDIQKL